MSEVRVTAQPVEMKRTEHPSRESDVPQEQMPPQSDPVDDSPSPLRVVGHGPAHPAGQAARAFGRHVVAYRAAHGLSQAALAQRLGWEQPHVARLEAGAHTPSLASLARLAYRLGLEVTVRATPQGMEVEVREAA
jgi:ribosome-binding protein aMBF1 (putative translation factor)